MTHSPLLELSLRTLGFTLGGIPFFAGVLWVVGRVAFTKRISEERADLLPGWIYVVLSLLWIMRGNYIFAVMAFPSFIIDWLLYRWWVRRRARRARAAAAK